MAVIVVPAAAQCVLSAQIQNDALQQDNEGNLSIGEGGAIRVSTCGCHRRTAIGGGGGLLHPTPHHRSHAHAQTQAQLGAQICSDDEMGGRAQDYWWGQSESEVTVKTRVDAGVKARSSSGPMRGSMRRRTHPRCAR